MANVGGFYDHMWASQQGLTWQFLQWKGPGSGAVTTTRTSPEIKSLTETGTGAYTIALNSPWAGSMFAVTFTPMQASDSSAGVCTGRVIEDHSTNVTTPEIKILLTNAAGAATALQSTDVMNVVLWMQVLNTQ